MSTPVAELEELLRQEKDAEQRDRLRAILMGMQGFVSDEIAVRLSRSRRFVQKWAAIYRAEGIERVRQRKSPGAKSKLSQAQEAQFAAEIMAVLNTDGRIRGKQVVELLRKKFGQEYSLQGAYELMGRLGLPIRHPKVERARRASVVAKGRSGVVPTHLADNSVEVASHASSNLLGAVLEAMYAGVLVVDPEGRVLLWNARFLAIWGIPPESADRRDDAQLLSGMLEKLHDPAAFMEGVRALHAMPLQTSNDELALRDGRFIERHSRPYLVEGCVAGRVWVFRDVTARVKAELALRTHGQRYAQVSSALTDLMGHMETLDHHDPHAMPRVVAECLAHALGMARAGVWFLSEEDTCLRCEDLYDARVDAYGEPAQWLASQCPHYFAAIARKRDVVAHDALAHPATVAMAGTYLEPADISSLLDCPIVKGGRVVGVVRLEQTAAGGRRFAGEDVLMTGMAAGLVARYLGEMDLRQTEHALAQARVAVRPDNSMASPWKIHLPTPMP